MERLNKNTVRKVVDGKTIYQINVGGKKFQGCCVCDEYFELTGFNNKYCPSCAKEENIRKTAEKNKIKYHANKLAQA